MDMNEKSAIAANHPPKRSARLRKWVGVRERGKIRKKKPLDPAAVVRDLSEAHCHQKKKIQNATTSVASLRGLIGSIPER